MDTSLGNPCANPRICTVTFVTYDPVMLLTVMGDGYGEAMVGGVGLSLITIAFVFENVNVPAATVEAPLISIAAVMRGRMVIIIKSCSASNCAKESGSAPALHPVRFKNVGMRGIDYFNSSRTFLASSAYLEETLRATARCRACFACPVRFN